MVWVIGLPVILLMSLFLYYRVRKHRHLKEELAQLTSLNRHSIEYELVLKAMKLSTWRLDVADGTLFYESDYRGRADSSCRRQVPVSSGPTTSFTRKTVSVSGKR